MKGDKLVIQGGHVKAAETLMKLLYSEIENASNKFIITIAGESGSGKSEIASAFSKKLTKKGVKNIILQQDDYFVFPPKTNANMRQKDINHVGLSEVHLALLDQNLFDVIDGKNEIEKPLVDYDEDRITKEVVKLEGIRAIIVEGTYTTILKNVHQHIFIDRTYVDTRETRKRRAREEQDKFLEKVLDIEHKIISPHKLHADIIITKDYDVMKFEKKE